jgi:uncharacterized lipoprotein NlpE involved in copper resistance
MKKSIILLSLSIVALAGCSSNQSRNDSWADNCEKHFSYNARELETCKNRVANHEKISAHAGSVVLNPDNATNTGEVETHKSRG